MVVRAKEGFQWLSEEAVTEEVSMTICRPTQALCKETEALTHAAEVWEATLFRLLAGQQFPPIASDEKRKRRPLLSQVLRLY